MRESTVQLQGTRETKIEKTGSVHQIEILKDSANGGFEAQTLWNTIETDSFRLICHGNVELRYSGLETHEERDDIKEMRFGDRGSFMVIAEDSPIKIYTNGRNFAGSCDIFWVEAEMMIRLFGRGV